MKTTLAALLVAVLTSLAGAGGAAADGDRASGEPVLLARAILPSDAYQPGPPSGAAITPDNGVTPPFPGQPIPGFSAVLDAGRGELLGDAGQRLRRQGQLRRLPAAALPDPARTSGPRAAAAARSTSRRSCSCATPTGRSRSR